MKRQTIPALALAGAIAGASTLGASDEQSLEEQLQTIAQDYKMTATPTGSYLLIDKVTDPQKLQETINKLEQACLEPNGTYACGPITKLASTTSQETGEPYNQKINPHVEVYVDTTDCDANRTATRLAREGIQAQEIHDFEYGGLWEVSTPLTYHYQERPNLQVQYAEHFDEAGKRFDIDPQIIATLSFIESAFSNDETSSSDARGAMQIKPGTAREYGYDAQDLNDPRKNIHAGAAYLSDALEATGDAITAAGAYHDGLNGVRQGLEKGCENLTFSKEGARHMRKFEEVQRATREGSLNNDDFSRAYAMARGRID